jgi:hypothetical protein
MKNLTLVFLAISFVGSVIAPEANGALKLRLSADNGETYTTIADGGAGDVNGDSGAITFIGKIGVWNLNVATAVGSEITGPGSIDLNSINNSTGAGTLIIEFTETDFDTQFPGWEMLFGGTLTGPAGSNVTATAWANDSNSEFATESLIGVLGPFSPGAFSGSTGGSASVDPYYSLTQRIVIDLKGAGQYSGDFNLKPLPEPATIAIWSTLGLAGALVAVRRRRR